MKAYKICTVFNRSQTHLVVADTMGEAEAIFKEKYKTDPESIELIAEYVQVKGEGNE
ncbi:MAG: hypothetical protein WC208_16090 [Gallionella sp.]|jgi:hypothetical protein